MSTEYSQDKLNERFNSESLSWKERYEAVDDGPWRYNNKLYRRHYTLELIGQGDGLVLDLGCGAGPYVNSLHRLGYQVVGMDAANEMVALASGETAKLGGHGWALRGDALNLPFAENTFDSLLAVGLLEYLPDDEEFLTKIGKILKPGGRAVVTLRNERCLERRLWRLYKKFGVDPDPVKYWYRNHNPADFEALLTKLGFKNIEHRYCHFYPFTWPFTYLLKPINALFANWMERKFNKTDADWMASTLIFAFTKDGETAKPAPLSDATFPSILRCPKTGGKLSEGKLPSGEKALVSEDGKWAYAFVGSGAPVLIADEAIEL